jgi:hypothetical protein
MNVEIRRTRAQQIATTLLVAATLWTLTGCGGSGSSGFDISPGSEAAAIAQAIDDETCVPFDKRTICASGVVADSGDFQGALVDIATPDEPLVCTDGALTTDCAASLKFTTRGFTTPNTLLAAVSESERGPWRQVPLAVVDDDPTRPRTVSITVPGTTGDARRKPLIAAVLVYVGLAPETVPQNAAHLADFGVDLVYVSQRLEIVVPR